MYVVGIYFKLLNLNHSVITGASKIFVFCFLFFLLRLQGTEMRKFGIYHCTSKIVVRNDSSQAD